MVRRTVKRVMCVGKATAFTLGISLMLALVLGMAVGAGPTGAMTCPPGEPDCQPPDRPPTVDADRDSVLVVHGQTATNTGTYSDDDALAEDVTITASVGEVTKTGTNSGTWSWSLANAPLGRQQVTITADDNQGASRTIEFTLTATLPNGKIAFSSARDIYTMNPDGSGRTNRTPGNLTLSLFPAISLDGTRIAYSVRNSFGDLDVYVFNINGSGWRGLTAGPGDDRYPAFSPDGTRIAFERSQHGNSDIYVMNAADGSGLTNLTNDPASDSQPAFSPDGSQIVFQSNRNGGNHHIYVMNADGSEPTRLTNSAHSFDPVFSPDGTRIAFVRDNDIFVMDAAPESATNQPQRLTNATGRDVEPSWSPDGTKITFASDRDGRVDSNGFTVSEIYVMNADGSNQVRLTNNTVTDASPSWGGMSDAAPPETTVVSGPSGPVNSNSVQFEFSSSEPDSAFECSLDGNPFFGCHSPRDYYNLAEGQHSFRVRAIDVSGNTDPTPASRIWTVDLTAPQTTIDSGPSGVSRSAASFTFSSSEANSTFRCKLSRQGDTPGSFTGCSSPQEYAELGDGQHTFQVRAIDAAGNTDASPATHTWRVDNAAPETTLDPSGPSGTVNTTSATFAFFSEAGMTFECKLDAASFSPCSSPTSYTDLSQGRHTFSVRAKDTAGNIDTSPASRTWTVDTTKPKVTVVSPAALATGVAPGTNVTATFSEKMKASTIKATTFMLFKVNSDGSTAQITDVVVTLSSDGLRATLNPFGTSSTLLARNTRYRALVTTGARDLAGNALAQPKRWTFTTR